MRWRWLVIGHMFLRRFVPPWLLVALLQLFGVALFFMLPMDTVGRPVLLVGLDAVTVAAVLWGTRRGRPLVAVGWYLLAVGQVINAAAWVCWYWYPVAAAVTLPAPSVGDLLFLASYAVSSVALGLLTRGHGARRGTMIDAAILASGVAVLAWVVFLARSVGTGLSLPLLAVNVGYIAGDVLLLWTAVAFAFTTGRSPRSLLLLGWVGLQLGADLVFNLQILDGSFHRGSAVFAGWLASFAVLSAAGLQPGAEADGAGWSRRWRRPIVLAAVVPLPVLLVVRAMQSSVADVMVIGSGSLLVTVLMVVRLSASRRDDAASGGAGRVAWRRSVVRLCAGITVLALLPLVGLAWLAIHEANSTMRAEVNRRLAASADGGVAYVGAQLRGLQDLVASYAERPSLGRVLSADGPVAMRQIQIHLESLQSRNPAFVGVWVTDASGTMLAFDPPAPTLIGRDFSHRDYFQGAVRTRAPYVSEAFTGAVPGHPLLVAVSAPILHGGRVVGVIALGYRLDALQGFTDNLARVQHVELTLTDRRATLLAGRGRDPSHLTWATGNRNVVAALTGASGTARGAEGGVDVLAAYRPIPGFGWAVVAEVPAAQAFAGARRFAGRFLAVSCLLGQVLLAGLVGAVRVERRRRNAEADMAEREETVSAILQAAGDAFVSIDADGRITRWNTQAEATFGWTAADALGQPLADLVVPQEHRDAHLTGIARVQAGGLSQLLGRRVEVQSRRRNGESFPAELTVWASNSPQAQFSAFIRDITDRKHAESQVAVARDAALAASRLKSEFVANMSHEIRTPMNGVIGLTDLLLDTDLDARQRDYLTTVQSSAEALLNVINDILDFSKIEAGKLDIDPIDFDVRAVVEDVVSLLAATAQAKGLEIAAVVNPAIPPALYGDALRIRQVLTNLASNAVKFTEEGEVVVAVAVSPATGDEPLHRVTFSVSDTGIGIPADRQPLLFEAFTQADASTTRRYGGTGLGLTISRQLVELMDGTIGLDSEPGHGSHFHVTLTLPAATTCLPAAPKPATDLTGIRVLVVDDNATNRTLVNDLTASWGMRPHAVAGAHQAVEAMHAAVDTGDPFTVALLDMHMPQTDGLELARMILADAALHTTRLAMLTSTDTEAHACRAWGIHAYLTKPIRALQLHALILELTGHTTPAVESGPPADQASSSRRGARILVAEDNAVNQQVAVEMLVSLGYTADVAANGEQALQLLQKRHYDAVLMDCQMPVLDGFQATERIRRLPPPLDTIPVIALTASALVSDQLRCRAAGMDHFLSKPVRRRHLDETLTTILGRADVSPIGTVALPPAQDDLLDSDMLQELRDMGPGFTSRILPNYLSNAPESAAAITAAAARHDLIELARLAHTLRGSSSTFAGHLLATTCGALEHAANHGDLTTIAHLTAGIEQQTEATCQALRAALMTDHPDPPPRGRGFMPSNEPPKPDEPTSQVAVGRVDE